MDTEIDSRYGKPPALLWAYNIIPNTLPEAGTMNIQKKQLSICSNRGIVPIEPIG